MAIAISYAFQPQDSPRGPRKFNHPSGDKTSKVECFKCQSTGHWAQKWQKDIPGPCPVCKQVIRSEPVQSQRGWGLPILRWLCWMTEVVQRFWQLPTTRWPISIKEPRVVFEMAGKKTSFLSHTRASYSIPISHAGLLSSKSCTMTDVGGKPCTFFFTGPPTCQFEQCLILRAFLVVPECPTPLVEETFWAPSEPYYDLEFLSSPFSWFWLRQISCENKSLLPAIFSTQ